MKNLKIRFNRNWQKQAKEMKNFEIIKIHRRWWKFVVLNSAILIILYGK